MADSSTITANERLKAISSALFQLGTALFGAGFVKIYVDQAIGLEASGWILTALGLMFAGWKVLYLLESES